MELLSQEPFGATSTCFDTLRSTKGETCDGLCFVGLPERPCVFVVLFFQLCFLCKSPSRQSEWVNPVMFHWSQKL